MKTHLMKAFFIGFGIGAWLPIPIIFLVLGRVPEFTWWWCSFCTGVGVVGLLMKD